ncbi:hypothetical protein EDC96DRAFT_324584 [Choanephora cucurbitarum]|nr:hypothetical protein EDC96DRAFT_324584 [Choanephora cucurbitarum]
MSTRHARTADKATNEKHTKILKALLQKTPNKYCADCKKKDARWASWNLGIFVCIRCSGIHRSLGVHISKVKSVDLDTWVQDQVENMVRWGNERANKYWEANLRDKKPSEGNMEMWIRAKYEQKRWAMKGPIPDPSTLGGDDEEEEEQVVQKPSSPVKQQQRQEKPKQSEFANLDAFLGSSTPSSPANTHQSKPAAASQLQGADFFFDSTPANNTNTTNSSPQPQAKQASTQDQKLNDFKSSILSLYNNMPAAMASPSVPSQPMNGSFQNQMAGLNFGQQQPQQFNQQQFNQQQFGQFNQQQFGQQQFGQQQFGQQQFAQQQFNQPQQQFNQLHSMSNNNAWANFASPAQPQPQGSQFFSSPNTAPAKKPEKKDVFADLLG